jgi:hypothetical protein
VRERGSGRVIAIVVVFVLLVVGIAGTVKQYQSFHPALLGGGASPGRTLVADHVYNLPVRYSLDGSPGVRIDAIHVPTIAGLDLTVTGVRCDAGVALKPLSEGPNLANSVYGPSLSPKKYFAAVTRKIYGMKIGTVLNPAACAVLAVHSRDPGTFHIGPLRIDWRAGLFVGHVYDHTDVDLTFTAAG